MQDRDKPDTLRPVDQISSDLDALRDLESSELRLGWSRQFAIVLLLVTAFVLLVWLGVTRSYAGRPVIYNNGIVSGPDTRSGAWVSSALEQALVATIQAGDQIRLINPNHPTATFPRFGSGALPGQRSGAQWLLDATLTAGTQDADTAVLHLTLGRVGAASPAFNAKIVGSPNAISDLAVRSVEQLHLWLELDGMSREQLDSAQSEVPSAAASEAYGKGLAALRAADGRAALEFIREASRLAPNNAAIHDGLARAWDLLGYAENASNESRLAAEASGSLSRRRQLELEAQHALRSEAWPRAQEVFGALKEFNPDELSYRLALTDTLIRQNDGAAVLASIAEMRALSPPAGVDPRIDLAEAWYWYNTGDYGRCVAAAQIAVAKARSSGSTLMLGEGLLGVGRCDNTYDPAVLLEAREVFKNLATASREPEILRELAKHERAEGNMVQQLAYLEEAVALSEQLGNEPQIAASNNSLAIAYDLNGRLQKGYELKRVVADYQLQRANMNRYSIVLENIGVSLFKMGRYAEALATIDQAEKIFVEIDDRIGVAWVPYRRGQIALRSGRLEEAKTLMTLALENSTERPEGNLALEATYELGLGSYFAGDYEQAGILLEDANRQYRELKLTLGIVESEIALARLRFSAGDLSAAQQHLNRAEESLEQDSTYYSLSLQIEKTNFDLLTGSEERRRACRRLQELAAGQEHMEYALRARVKIAVCRVLVFGRAHAEAEAILAEVEAQAAGLGVFEPLIAAGYARAALLAQTQNAQHARVEEARVRQLAANNAWRPHPAPGITLQR